MKQSNMTRRLQQTVEDGRSRKRILKPVVEKKRRDRINQSLAELRSLLLNSTSDPRLQNPKIEKAEILDVTVEYLQKWTQGTINDPQVKPPAAFSLSEVSAPPPPLPPPPPPPPLFSIESAGFQQCVAQLTSYMHRIPPAQRAGLIEGLKRHAETQQPKPDLGRKVTGTPDAASAEAICTSDGREEFPRLLFPSHSPFQPHSCSTPGHDHVSPPPSPWLSPSFSTYASSSPFPSFACHFSFPPSLLSPPSCNTSFFSLSPTPPGLHAPTLTTLRPPPHPELREGSAPNCPSAMWRPWS